MTNKKSLVGNGVNSAPMAFGFDRDTDEKSLAAFLGIAGGTEMTEILVPRLTDQEIESVLELFMGLMKKHLSKGEYHRLFLGDK